MTIKSKKKDNPNGESNGVAPANRIAEHSRDMEHYDIPRPVMQAAVFVVRGSSPLMHNNFCQRSLGGMQDKQQGVVRAKGFRCPMAEFVESLYILPDSSGYYLKPQAFKCAMVDATRFVDGVSKNTVGSAITVLDTYVQIHGSHPVMTHVPHRIGRFGSKVAIVQYRGVFPTWYAAIRIKWLANHFTAAQIAALLMYAGLGGVGDCRPNSVLNKGGTYGQFELLGMLDDPDVKREFEANIIPKKDSIAAIAAMRQEADDAMRMVSTRQEEAPKENRRSKRNPEPESDDEVKS